MRGFEPVENKPIPTFHDILQRIDDLDIYRNYIPNLKVNCAINSPFGKDDVPSFSVFWSHRYSKFKFKDHRHGWKGDCFDFVMRYFGLNSLLEASMKVCVDFNIYDFHIYNHIYQTNPSINLKVKKNKDVFKTRPDKFRIQVQTRGWNQNDLIYWNQFGITLKWLELGNVFPIKYYWIEGNLKLADEYSYAYIESKDGKTTYKIYQPFNKKRKWRNNNDSSVWELWTLLPEKGDILIITKSRKDALSIMSTSGIPSTALQAEGTIPKEVVIDELKKRFKFIVLLYDNDFDKKTNYGRVYGEKLSRLFKIPQIEIPEEYGEKDYSDLVCNVGQHIASRLLWYLVKKQYLMSKRDDNK